MEKETKKELHTYKAVIRHDPVEHHDYIEWISGKPKTNVPIEVDISVWEEPWGKRRVGKDRDKAVDALRKIAERGGVRSIPDPLAWQREIRKDRPLPGRD